jgi:hypothetical protein
MIAEHKRHVEAAMGFPPGGQLVIHHVLRRQMIVYQVTQEDNMPGAMVPNHAVQLVQRRLVWPGRHRDTQPPERVCLAEMHIGNQQTARDRLQNTTFR